MFILEEKPPKIIDCRLFRRLDTGVSKKLTQMRLVRKGKQKNPLEMTTLKNYGLLRI